MNLCIVCNTSNSKYKCPQCFSRYCSVACCKEHKESCQQNVTVSASEPEPPKTKQTSNVPNYPLWTAGDNKILPQDISLEDTVSPDLLNQLKDDGEIRSALHNPHLRAMMETLVNSDNPHLCMAEAMQEPIFTEFADRCLKIVDKDNKHIEREAPPLEIP